MELLTGTLVVDGLITQYFLDQEADVNNWQRLQ